MVIRPKIYQKYSTESECTALETSQQASAPGGISMILQHFRKRPDRGFTLVEILVVLVIIGLLAAIVGPRLFPKLGKGKQAAAKAQIELFGQALDQFRLDVGRYPTTQEGLNALMTNPGIEKWEGPYLKKELPVDPWNRPYLYQQPGTQGEYDLYTFGSDGVQGGDGEAADVTSWK